MFFVFQISPIQSGSGRTKQTEEPSVNTKVYEDIHTEDVDSNESISDSDTERDTLNEPLETKTVHIRGAHQNIKKRELEVSSEESKPKRQRKSKNSLEKLTLID